MAKRNSSSRKSNGRNQKIENQKDTASVRSEPDVNEEVAYSEEGEGVPSVFACPECHGVVGNSKLTGSCVSGAAWVIPTQQKV